MAIPWLGKSTFLSLFAYANSGIDPDLGTMENAGNLTPAVSVSSFVN